MSVSVQKLGYNHAMPMKTDRLYYRDAYTTTFSARVIERVHAKDRLGVVLNSTYFYPESGGQPADHGRINNSAVKQVEIRPTDGAIIHWLADDIYTDDITGKINWRRRFNHMQQHTGQHILSQAFIQVCRAETVGFHLTDSSLTIDLNTQALTARQIQDAEQMTNDIIWQNRPVKIHFVTHEQAENLPLRKLPPIDNQKIRLIEIDEFDMTACGGTHVERTSAVGLLKITRLERQSDKLRVHFVCGHRALQDYRQKNNIINQLMAQLTTGADDLVPNITKMQNELKSAQRKLNKQRDIVLEAEASTLLSSAVTKNKVTVVSQAFAERDAAELRTLGNFITSQPGAVALLGATGSKTVLLFSRSDDAPGQMNQLLKSSLQMLEGGGGGGSPSFAQGGSGPINIERLQKVIARAEKLLLGQLS